VVPKHGVGFHAELAAVDLGQYLSWENSRSNPIQVAEPKVENMIAPTAVIGVAFGRDKLTDEANDELDRAQVVLYRELLRLSGAGEPHATVLRFLPHLRESSLKDAAVQGVAEKVLRPVLEQMPGWIADPSSAPATSRKDLCASCPMSEPCARSYPDRLSPRDDPPTTGTRPHDTAEGKTIEVRSTASAKAQDDDAAGRLEAETLRDRILAELSQLGASASCPAPPVVGPRTYLIELTRKSGSVSALDRAAADVQHRLAAELDVDITYEKDRGHRRFLMTRKSPRPVFLEPMLRAKEAFLSASSGRFVVGATPAGEVVTGDFSDGSAAHLLVAGQTGSGKSVFIQALVASLVQYHGPEAIRFTLVDPKRVTFTSAAFRASIAAHLEGPVCYDAEEVLPVVAHLVEQMEERYRLFEGSQVSDLAEYNDACPQRPLERKVLIVDEFQDLLIDKDQSKAFLAGIQRLGAKARAAGIHLVLATQRPSKQAIPPIIKANLVGKIAFQVANAVDSRIVLDQGGAERLLGKGDLLVNLGRGTIRAQAALLAPR